MSFDMHILCPISTFETSYLLYDSTIKFKYITNVKNKRVLSFTSHTLLFLYRYYKLPFYDAIDIKKILLLIIPGKFLFYQRFTVR